MTVETLLLRDLWLVPMDGPANAPLGEVRRGALRLHGDRIEALGDLAPRPGERVVDGGGKVALPGFVQGHVHATQTLFRGLGDDLPLLPWLQQRIWPLEHAHDAASTRASARLTFAELLAGGTTTVQTMESVRHTEHACDAALASGITAIVGNCLMDEPGGGVPAGMATTRAEALAITEGLRAAYDGRSDRLWIAVAPRFALSCSDALARDAAAYAAQHGLRVHTHAAEHPDELAAVRARFGKDYLEVLADQGLLGPRTSLAHCVHTSRRERELLVASDSAVLHCPSTNLKLGSGIAPIAAYRALGLRIALGADGAACNNRLSALTELRALALLQDLAAGPGVLRAEDALWLATRGGALALGLPDRGSLAAGQRADVVLCDLTDPRLGAPLGAWQRDPATAIAGAVVHAADERCLTDVFAGGALVVRDGTPAWQWPELGADVAATLPGVLQRAGLAR